MHWYA